MVSAQHVVLGLLIERPGYAYEVQQRVRARFAFADLSDNVVYGVLEGLKRHGWAERVGVKQAGRTERGAPRVIYGATPDGAGEFARWIDEPWHLKVALEELCAKLMLARPIDWPRVIATAEQLEASCLGAIGELHGARQPTLAQLMDEHPSEDVVGEVLVGEAERLRLQSMVDWLEQIRVYGQKRVDAAGRRSDG